MVLRESKWHSQCIDASRLEEAREASSKGGPDGSYGKSSRRAAAPVSALLRQQAMDPGGAIDRGLAVRRQRASAADSVSAAAVRLAGLHPVGDGGSDALPADQRPDALGRH